MKKAVDMVVFMLSLLASVIFDIASGIIIFDGYQDVETILYLVSIMVAIAAFDIHLFGKFVRD